MIAVIGTFRIPLDQLERARPPMREVIAATLIEEGCIEYAYAEDVAEAGRFRVCELWLSREHLAAHFETAHMKRWVELRATLGFYDRAIAVHDIGPGEPV